MISRSSVGAWLVAAGAALAAAGLLVRSGAFAWFGRLPGDIRVERPHVQVYVPVTSMLLLSLAVSAVLWIGAALVRRLR